MMLRRPSCSHIVITLVLDVCLLECAVDEANDEPRAAALQKSEQTPGELVNSIGMKLALIPAGDFRMGSDASDPDAESDELPKHLVRITRDFHLGVHEVTQSEYEKIMGINPSWFSATGPGKADVKGENTANHPVDMVTWFEAVKFCERLSALPSERSAGRRYRLPTEAEWEYACRAGTTTPFSTGAILSPSDACFRVPRADGSGFDPIKTAPVGSYKPNSFGIHDMHGNVWEWCVDWYVADAYRSAPEKDPTGPIMGTGKVIRGGAWNFPASYCRAANRDLTRASRRDTGNGFRVVCETR